MEVVLVDWIQIQEGRQAGPCRQYEPEVRMSIYMLGWGWTMCLSQVCALSKSDGVNSSCRKTHVAMEMLLCVRATVLTHCWGFL